MDFVAQLANKTTEASAERIVTVVFAVFMKYLLFINFNH
ncbi:putative membrane protein [Streptococcus mitis]|nr:putative membrane protein [Streptococcus mitis]